MKTKFTLTIEFESNIPETIPPELIKRIIADTINETNIHYHAIKTKSHQAFIDYIKQNA